MPVGIGLFAPFHIRLRVDFPVLAMRDDTGVDGSTIMNELRAAALKVRENAYAPYSNFLVGAAIATPSGAVYVGCNVENVAYPQGTCAEAGAIAAMIAAGEREISAAYVVAGSPTPVPPCGGCRQKLAEFASADVIITMATTDGTEHAVPMGDLLPGAFAAAHMGSST